MASTTQQFNTIEDFFIHQLEDIYDAEKRLTSALPKMRDSAHNSDLKTAFDEHLKETENQIARLDKVFESIGKRPQRESCEAMKGLIKEGEEMIQSRGDESAHDAALIAAAQRVEHYEIAAYGTARSLADRLERREAVEQLEATLAEEKSADDKLNAIAERQVNPEMAH
ncbi:MAG: ferritin-like domain-containing protein [Halofilum sp. (in: g-proteobacteria)]